jgi:hypothetical protein
MCGTAIFICVKWHESKTKDQRAREALNTRSNKRKRISAQISVHTYPLILFGFGLLRHLFVHARGWMPQLS